MVEYKRISVIADIMGIIAVMYLFFSSYQTKCFSLRDWYIALIPISISYITQFLALLTEDKDKGLN